MNVQIEFEEERKEMKLRANFQELTPSYIHLASNVFIKFYLYFDNNEFDYHSLKAH
jgi:hypothetical protein